VKKLCILFVLIVLLLSACQKTSSNTFEVITLKQLLSSFQEQNLSLKEIEVSKDNILGMRLNGARPIAYKLNGKRLMFYIYDTSKEREKGLEDFRNKTETANVVSYNYYEVKNVLIFYVYEDELNIEVDKIIKNIVSKLNAPK
jgi:hypothetical protein